MNMKIIFIDIDGTLTDKFGRIPKSAMAAVRHAMDNGHQVFLCTGRSKVEYRSVFQKLKPTGVIGAGGSFVQTGDEIIQASYFSSEEISHLVQHLTEHRLSFYLTTDQEILVSERLAKKLKWVSRFIPREKQKIFRKLTTDELETIKVNKVNFINRELPLKSIISDLVADFAISPSTIHFLGEDSGEIMPPGISKRKGIEALLKRIDGSFDATIGIGNGKNDIELFAGVKEKVAVRNADEQLKQLATYVTEKPQNDGIQKAFEYYGLI